VRPALLLAGLLSACTFDEGPEVPDPPAFEDGTHPITDVATLLAGPGAEAEAGTALAAGDFDGDGRIDLAVGAPGRDGVAVYTGLDDPPVWIDGPADSRFGAALAAGDFDGDGVDELAIGAPDHGERDDDGPDSTGLAQGAVFVHRLSGLLATLPGANAGDCAGASVAADDVTGDGLADLLLGAPCRGSYRYEDPAIALSILAQGPGVAWLMASPLSGDLSLADAVATYPGSEDFDQAGKAVLFGDLDDVDGPDVVVGAPDYYGAEWVNPSGRGHARVWSGTARGELHAGDAFLTVRGGCCGADLFDETGTSLAAGDLDGDGHDELLVGAPEAVDFGILGAAWLVPGPASGEIDGLQATVLAAAPEDQGESGSEMGRALSAGFDLDSDGVLELAIGGPTDARAVDAGGVVQILEGLPDGYTELFSTGTILTATATNQSLGAAFAWGDFDGDGRDELAVGAPGDRTVGHRAGGVFVVDLSN
jgi:hypothetical protein